MVVKDSNIADLINDAMRERKIVKAASRNQFALLLRVLNISSALVRNKRLLSTHSVTINNVKLPRTTSMPFISKASFILIVSRARRRRKTSKLRTRNRQEKLILSRTWKILPYLCKWEKIGYSVGKKLITTFENWHLKNYTMIHRIIRAIRRWII